jgi:hypothetical protein
MRRVVQEGPYPWWTLPELRIAFWRPLSSALEALDYRLFGLNALGYHVHSVAWHLGLVAIFGSLLRRFVPGALGGLALLLFVVDDAHLLPVGWISNRNALVSTAFALLGVWMHLEWRESRKPWALPVSLGALALGLLAGETALGVFAYLLAYEWLGARGTVAERLRALAPAAVLAGVYLGVYKALGYGAHGSTMYVDPVGEPVSYLGAALGRVPALVGGLLGLPVDAWGLSPESRPVLIGLGLGGAGLMVYLLRRAWPGMTGEERRHCRWLALGAGLSLLPVASAMPMGRLLLVPGLGASVLLAAVLRHAWRARKQARGLALTAGVLVLLNGVLAPLSWPAMALLIPKLGADHAAQAERLRRELESPRFTSQRVVLLDPMDLNATLYIPILWARQGLELPRSWWPLSLAMKPVAVTRTGASSLELERADGGPFLAGELEQVLRSPAYPLGTGAQVRLEGMRVTVLAADARGPTRLGFDFGTPLEDPSLVFLHTRAGALTRFTPPPVGTRLDLSPGL